MIEPLPDCAAQHFGLWLIEPSRLQELVAMWKAGLLQPQPARRPTDDPTVYYVNGDGIAVIPIVGMMTKGESTFGGTSSLFTRRKVSLAASDDKVKAILMTVDSPGGSTAGVADLADAVKRADARKPVFTQIEDLGASAAYWVASQARFVAATRTSMIGSIGAMAVLVDESERLDREGIKVRVVTSAKKKAVGVSSDPITDDDLADIKRDVIDPIGAAFLADVNASRGTNIEANKGPGDGRSMIANAAKEAGLIDAVQTVDATLRQLRAEARIPDIPAMPKRARAQAAAMARNST